MEKEFVPYELALRMKALGFDEPCISFFEKKNASISFFFEEGIAFKGYGKPFNYNKHSDISRPTFSQTFRWFREKHELYGSIEYMDDLKSDWGGSIKGYYDTWGKHDLGFTGWFKTYEEAELACLENIIVIVESKKE